MTIARKGPTGKGIPKMREVVTLGVTSFRASINGEHYYGKLHVEPKMTNVVGPDGGIGRITRMGDGDDHPHHGHELQRRVGAREAAYLNRKDGDDGLLGGGLKAGDLTKRFNDVESIVEAAITTFGELFDATDVLMFERQRLSGDYEILVAPPEVKAAIPSPNNRRIREEWLMANGYLLTEDDADGNG